MKNAPHQICIYSTTLEHEAIILQDQLIDANVDVMMLNKKDSAYGIFGQIELYVPIGQAEKAKTLINSFRE